MTTSARSRIRRRLGPRGRDGNRGRGSRPNARARPGAARPGAVLAGIAAAGTALAVTELVGAALAPRRPSVIGAVASRLVVLWAGALADPAIRLFGRHDKTALLAGIVVVSLLAGGGLGLLAARRASAALAGFALCAAAGVAAAAADPLAAVGTAVAASAAGLAAGAATLLGLLHLLAPGPNGGPGGPERGRRRVVVGVGLVVAGVASLGSAGVSRVLRAAGGLRIGPDHSLPAARRATAVPAAESFAVPGLTTYVTPTNQFYRVDTATFVPQVDAASWRLRLGGRVDHPATYGYADLLEMDLVEEPVTLACVSNDVGGHLIGNARWRGVPLPALLERAGVHPDATQIVGRSVDGFTVGIPTASALDGRVALVALGMNGRVLPLDHGFPARLIVAGLYGYASATKWLTDIELTRRDDVDGFWVERGWAKDGPIRTSSRIDVVEVGAPAAGPASGSRPRPARAVTIAGVAWAPPTGIGRVEVQLDRGAWRIARLGAVASPNTWVQWRYEWPDAPPGDHLVAVRAVDRSGVVQIEEPSTPKPSGATGYHYWGFTVG